MTNGLEHTRTPNVKLGVRRLGFVSVTASFILFGVLGTWAATTMISGAVIATGEAVISGDIKTIQSLDGGIVRTISVSDGDSVEAGQVLVQLDPTLLQTNRDIAEQRLAAALAMKSRLQAEQQGTEDLVFSYPILPFPTPDTLREEAIQRAIFDARAQVSNGLKEQLTQTLAQYDNRQQGIQGQIDAVREQIVFLEEDLANQQRLAAQQLVRQSEISRLQQQLADRNGQLATLLSELSQIDGARRTAELELMQTQRTLIEETAIELQTVNGDIEERILEILTLEEQLSRVDVRAPTDGVIHQMQITTTGGILAPGGTILEIVPTQEDIEFEVRLDPRTIDKVYVGQPARMVIASADAELRPEFEAQVSSISPGTVTDPVTRQSYYLATLTVSAQDIAQLETTDVLPGMPVEAFLAVNDRSILAYLVQPISQHLRRAFRE